MHVSPTRDPVAVYRSRRFVFLCNAFCCALNLLGALMLNTPEQRNFLGICAGFFLLLTAISGCLAVAARPGRFAELFKR